MTKSFAACSPEDNLAVAVKKMWENDCGVIPIVEDNCPVAMVTDRDVAIAVASSGRAAAEILVTELGNGKVHVCGEKDDVKRALKIMASKRLRRLAVVDKKGNITGMLSIADLLNASGSKKSMQKSLMKAMQKISKPHPIVLFGD